MQYTCISSWTGKLKDTTQTSASYLYLLFSVTNGTITTKLYAKRDDFDFRIVKLAYICSNIPMFSAYGVYISFRNL